LRSSNFPFFSPVVKCRDIVAGLDHIHCNALVHGAIRAVSLAIPAGLLKFLTLVKKSNILVKSDGTACLGEFADEYIPSENTIALYASYIAPEQVDVKKLYKLLIDNYRDTNYEGEHKMESDIFALGCCMVEVRFVYPCIVFESQDIPKRFTLAHHQNHCESRTQRQKRSKTSLECGMNRPT
jgi:serine/threonine protein kinase